MQVALNVILAQIGCFVPATFASIAPADRLFTRIGTSDCLETNSSSFMVEMQVGRGVPKGEAGGGFRSNKVLSQISERTGTSDRDKCVMVEMQVFRHVASCNAQERVSY